MFMMIRPNNLIFIALQQGSQFALLFKGIMLLYSLTGKQEQEKHIQWRVLNTTYMMSKEESFPAQYKIFSSIYRVAKTNKQNSW